VGASAQVHFLGGHHNHNHAINRQMLSLCPQCSKPPAAGAAATSFTKAPTHMQMLAVHNRAEQSRPAHTTAKAALTSSSQQVPGCAGGAMKCSRMQAS